MKCLNEAASSCEAGSAIHHDTQRCLGVVSTYRCMRYKKPMSFNLRNTRLEGGSETFNSVDLRIPTKVSVFLLR